MSFGGTGGYEDRDLDRPAPRREPAPLEYDTGASRGAAKVKVPGILMIVTGVLNLVVGLSCGLGGLGMKQAFTDIPASELKKAYDKQGPEGQKNLEGIGVKNPEDLRSFYINCGWGGAYLGFSILPSGLVYILGGVLMCARKVYWLTIVIGFICIVSGIAFLAACCYGVVPIAIGIWAVVALFSPDVRAAFQASSGG